MTVMKHNIFGQYLIYPLFKKTFDIREGELHRTVWMFAYLFLLICALSIAKPVSTALFLAKFSARHLPEAYMMTAVLAATLSWYYSFLLKNRVLKGLMRTTLISAICCLVIFWAFIYFKIVPGMVLYLFFIWSSLITLICASQFWLAAGLFFNIREAKRLFGAIGSGAIAGGIAGGYLTRFMAPVVGSDHLILISALCLAVCIAIMEKLWRTYDLQDRGLSPVQPDLEPQSTRLTLSIILKSRHLRYTALILAVSVITARLVDYQFNTIVSEMIRDKDELAAFLGLWMSNLNIVSLLIQIVLTRKALELFGVSYSLLFMPAAVLLGAIATLFSPALWSAVFIKVSEGGFKNSLNKSGMELIFLPVPLKIKSQAKAFIDIFVDSAAGGIGGLILAGLVFGLNVAPAHISLVIGVLVGIWIALVLSVKQEYLKYFIEKFKPDASLDDLPMGPIPENEKIIQVISAVLSRGDTGDILNMMQRISGFHSEKLSDNFIYLLEHPDPNVCAEALRQLYFLKNIAVRDRVARLLYERQNLTVRTEAMRYLFHFDKQPFVFLQTQLGDSDYRIRGAALLCLVWEARRNRLLRSDFNPGKMVEQLLFSTGGMADERQAAFTRNVCARAIGVAEIQELHPYLFLLMEDRDPEVATEAIVSAGKTQNPVFIRNLFSFLGRSSHYRSAAVQGLISHGPQVLDDMEKALSNIYMSYVIRKQIPEVIAAFNNQKAVDILTRHLVESDIGMRYEVIRALNRLRAKSGTLLFDKKKVMNKIKTEADDYMEMLLILYRQMSIESIGSAAARTRGSAREQLIKALEDRLDENLERIFRLLGLSYPPVEMYNAYQGIKSQDAQTRVTAMEFLDNMLEINIKQVIIPVIETGFAPRQDVLVKNDDKEIPGEFESYVTMLKGEDDVLKEKTLNLLIYQPDDRFLPLMAELLGSPSRGVRSLAARAIEKTGHFMR
nr:hypothetical protein [uncultured Desulfobacter sp.]